MDSNVNKILQNIVNTATLAADEAKAAVHSAGKAVAGKYDEVKMNIELARLSDEQEDVFSDIGRMLFLMHTGAVKDTVMSDEGEKVPAAGHRRAAGLGGAGTAGDGRHHRQAHRVPQRESLPVLRPHLW